MPSNDTCTSESGGLASPVAVTGSNAVGPLGLFAKVDDINRARKRIQCIGGNSSHAEMVVAKKLKSEVPRHVMPVRLHHYATVRVADNPNGVSGIKVMLCAHQEVTFTNDRAFQCQLRANEGDPLEGKDRGKFLVLRAAKIQVHTSEGARRSLGAQPI